MSSEIEVKVPSVGESVTEAAIGRWLVNDGDYVEKDQPVLELDSDKASMEVTADSAGVLKHSAKEGDTVSIGAVVAKISPNGKAKSATTSSSNKKEAKPTPTTKSKENSSDKASTKSSVDKNKIKDFSPSKRKAIRHGKLELLDAGAATSKASAGNPEETRTPMSSLRKTIAQRLLHSQQSTATLTTFNEVDMSQLLEVRSKLKDSFHKKFEIKLGFMSFFSAAIAHAVKHYPIVNAQMDKDEIVQPQHLNLGVAVSTDKGLVVPVVRNADLMSYAELEKSIATLAEKARSGKLSIAEMQGGSFTITNGGVFGSLLSTPILNPPQSGILGMHKTEHRPVAIQKENGDWTVEVRPMMYLALSYDHRIIDGATSVGFLVKVKEYIETVTEDQVLS